MGGSGLRGVLFVEPTSERGLLTLVKAERGEPIETSEREVTRPRGDARVGPLPVASLSPLPASPAAAADPSAEGRPQTPRAAAAASPSPGAECGRSISRRSRRGMVAVRAGRAGTGSDSLPAAAAARSEPKSEVPFCFGDLAADEYACAALPPPACWVDPQPSESCPHDPVRLCALRPLRLARSSAEHESSERSESRFSRSRSAERSAGW